MVKIFIFDYGRTLFDREREHFFDDATEVLEYLSNNYRLAIVSFSKPDDVQGRVDALVKHGIYDLFEEIVFCSTPEGKDDAYLGLSNSTGIPINEMAIVDDYVIRGIAWGNRNGATTYWFKNGKFSHHLPNSTTGVPTHTIRELRSILDTLEVT